MLDSLIIIVLVEELLENEHEIFSCLLVVN
jgi:hypothetical protein